MMTGAATIPTPGISWAPILPALILFGAALLILAIRSVARARWNPDWMPLAVTGGATLASGFALVMQSRALDREGPFQTFGGMVVSDHFAAYTSIAILIGLAFALVFLPETARARELPLAEMLVLLLLAAAGMQVMVSAFDLIVVFLGLELFSIALYVLVGIDTRRTSSLEGAFKYLILGAFSSAILLYGIAMVYASAGSTNLGNIAEYFANHVVLEPGTMLLGIMLLIVGFGFKIATVPFHMWAPDAYEGAPTPITSFMAATVKVGAVAALIRVISVAYESNVKDWQPVLFVLAALSMLVGAVVGLTQGDVKRMLAYSSITHAGYLLVGVQAGTRDGQAATLYYLLAYAVIVSGTFGVLTVLERDADTSGGSPHRLARYVGLGTRRPVLAALLVFFLIAQAGIPFTSGFTAKLAVFQAGVGADQYGLVLVAVVAAAIAAFMYLRVIVAMYFQEVEKAETEPAVFAAGRTGIGPRVALGLAVVGTLWLGIAPDWWMRWADNAPACVEAATECVTTSPGTLEDPAAVTFAP